MFFFSFFGVVLTKMSHLWLLKSLAETLFFSIFVNRKKGNARNVEKEAMIIFL